MVKLRLSLVLCGLLIVSGSISAAQELSNVDINQFLGDLGNMTEDSSGQTALDKYQKETGRYVQHIRVRPVRGPEPLENLMFGNEDKHVMYLQITAPSQDFKLQFTSRYGGELVKRGAALHRKGNRVPYKVSLRIPKDEYGQLGCRIVNLPENVRLSRGKPVNLEFVGCKRDTIRYRLAVHLHTPPANWVFRGKFTDAIDVSAFEY